MRLHRIEVAAFGPYAGEEVVDADALGADGLFLLHGPTGAGKTSLLDAVAFALFGRVPGARQQAGRLRCDSAEPGAAPWVRLELTLGGRRLRVTRSPEWQRPKRRGEGTTREPARALLEEVAGDVAGGWRCVSARVDEVSHLLHDRLGLSADQFFQVVLLPQGEFAHFLRAESTEREQLLERLFGTRRFAEVETWLKARRSEAQATRARAEHHVSRALVRLCQAAGVASHDEPACADAPWRAGLAAAATRAAEAADADARAAEKALRAAEREHRRLETLAALQRRRLDAEQARAKVEAGRAEHEGRLAELDAARRAAPVRPLVAAWLRAREEAERATAEVVARRLSGTGGTGGTGTGGAGGTAGDTLDGLRDWSAALRDELGGLALLGGRVAELAGVEDRLSALDDEIRTAGAAATRRAERLAALPDALAAARAAAAAADQAAARLPGLADAVARAEEAHAAAVAHVAARPELDAARGRRSAAVDAHQAARDAVLVLRGRRLDQMAAELAASLRPGAQCPVCGGAEHPAPAHAEPSARVSEADEAAAAAVEERRRRERERAERAVADGERRQAEREVLMAGRTADAWERELGDGRAALADARRVMAGRATCRSTVDILEAEQRAEAEAARADAARRAELAATVEGLRGAAAALRAELDAARGDDPTVPARRARLTRLVEAVEALVEAHRTAEVAAASAAAAAGAAGEEARRNGFDDAEAAAAAALPDRELAALAAACDAFARREAAAAAALADPDVAAVDPGEPVDPLPAALAWEAARLAHTRAAAGADRAGRVRDDVVRLGAELAAAEEAAAPVRDHAARVTALAELVAGQGQNTRRMTLRAYVLAARLAEVAAVASERLAAMSAGRFRFVHTESADSARVRAGLGLEVLDAYSGLTRSTKTLSGGESFLASLALALGLADVVTAEAGGVRLDTLFIDEGFGGLDADTLDLVMDTLDELRAGGRVVGVVSHVEEMRHRIPVRLRVHRTGATSRLELDTA